ncbi:MAG TPA: hypothetical protein VJR50_04310, partial [Mycobacterium sp.]|nr:hypothetical protein [Mycobacterium sp.]
LTAALQNYGGVVIQAGYNHAVAEYNATAGNRGAPPQRPPEPAPATGVLSAPPSAGGPGKGLFDTALGLAEQIGMPVPDGDTLKVDTAAQAWDRLATVYQTVSVVEALDVNARVFSETHSPEVELIVKDLHELRDATAAVLDGCRELAQSCMDYKAALEDLRDQLLGILEDLAIELAVTATIAILASCVTFGAGAAAGTAKAAHTISKFAGIIRSAVNGWKISKRISEGVKRAHNIAAVRTRLERIKSLRRKAKAEERPLPSRPVGAESDWVSRPANNGHGVVYQKPGSSLDSNSIRIMEPGTDPTYPNGYVKFTNSHNQPIGLDGRPGSRAHTHIPRNPDGSYPIPEGW